MLFCCDGGGGGRAKGFGGPDTLADRSADAEGDGGGRSIPLWLRSGFADLVADAARGEPEPDSFSSDSEGMFKLSFGRTPLLEPFVSLLLGGANSADTDAVVVARIGWVAGRLKPEEG